MLPFQRSFRWNQAATSTAMGLLWYGGKTMTKRHKTIAVAMSGGIDSSVAAMLLQEQFPQDKVVGVFMTNWNSSDEVGKETCSISRDREDMRNVCVRLGIEAIDANFTNAYWNEVFVPFLESYQSGVETPNPDVMCNRFIKFIVFKRFAFEKLGATTIATGHYAQLVHDSSSSDHVSSNTNGNIHSEIADSELVSSKRRILRLLKGIDPTKDQSYFLSMTPGHLFNNVLFPLGHYFKHQVRQIAMQSPRLQGLSILTKPESMGVCFIGKRSMPEFLSNYIPLTSGRFIDVDTGREVGRHEGKEALTIGQGARIGGCRDKYFIVTHGHGGHGTGHGSLGGVKGGPLGPGDVWVARGTHHPALFSTFLVVRNDEFSWVSGELPITLQRKLGQLREGLGQGIGQGQGLDGVDRGLGLGLAQTAQQPRLRGSISSIADGRTLPLSSNEHMNSNTDSSRKSDYLYGFKARHQQPTARYVCSRLAENWYLMSDR